MSFAIWEAFGSQTMISTSVFAGFLCPYFFGYAAMENCQFDLIAERPTLERIIHRPSSNAHY